MATRMHFYFVDANMSMRGRAIGHYLMVFHLCSYPFLFYAYISLKGEINVCCEYSA